MLKQGSLKPRVRLLHMSVADARRNAVVLREIMKKLGYTDDRGPSMRGSTMASTQAAREKQREQVKDAQKNRLEEKREIVANRKQATDAGTAAAIVL